MKGAGRRDKGPVADPGRAGRTAMEVRVGENLVETLGEPPVATSLSAAILRRFADLGGVDLEPPSRDSASGATILL